MKLLVITFDWCIELVLVVVWRQGQKDVESLRGLNHPTKAKGWGMGDGKKIKSKIFSSIAALGMGLTERDLD